MDAHEKIGQSILLQELGNFYNGQSFEQLKTVNYFSGFYLKTCHEQAVTIERETVMRLIEIDVKMGGNIDDIVSGSWNKLTIIDDGRLLNEIQDKFPTQYNKGSKLLRLEMGEDYSGQVYKKLLSTDYNGYSEYYLRNTASKQTCSTRAKLETLMKLVEIDLEKGTTIPETIYYCCKYAPLIENIKSHYDVR